MHVLKSIVEYPLVTIFLGTLPLFGGMVWGLLQNDRRLTRIETQLDRLDTNIKSVETSLRADIKALDTSLRGDIKALDTRVAGIGERLVKGETRLHGGALLVVPR